MTDIGGAREGGQCNPEDNLEIGIDENKDRTRMTKLGVTIKFWTMKYEVNQYFIICMVLKQGWQPITQTQVLYRFVANNKIYS